MRSKGARSLDNFLAYCSVSYPNTIAAEHETDKCNLNEPFRRSIATEQDAPFHSRILRVSSKTIMLLTQQTEICAFPTLADIHPCHRHVANIHPFLF